MRPLVALLAAALAHACASSAPSTPQEVESAFQAHAQTVRELDGITLFSPYGAEPTEEYARVLLEQSALVRALFEDRGIPPVRFYLVPAPDDGKRSRMEVWDEPSSDGFGGMTFREGFAFVYVLPEAEPNEVAMHAVFAASTMRHELAHLCARRAGLDRAAWFNEGLAREVEHMRAGPDGPSRDAFPTAFITARKKAKIGTVSALLNWTLADGASIDVRAERYEEAEALFRFLAVRNTAASFRASAQAVMDLDDESIVALEPEWLRWLAGLDVLDAVRTGVKASDTSARREAAAMLPILAERGAKELSTRAADELALELLGDPATFEPAATFLIFFRAHALKEADLADLCRSTDPARCLAGLALRRQRGERVDPGRAYAEWKKVPASDRARLQILHRMLDLGTTDVSR